MANEVIEIKAEKTPDLSVALTDNSIRAMSEQRARLKEFVKTQLVEGIHSDYAIIPGTNKQSLLKPGAEKLANIFQLGSRIVDVQREIDPKSQYAMFTYTVELFHIPTGRAVTQCQGSANTLEKKQQNKDFGFQLNSLGKMAQKRAFVGAVISAVGASDFFTQDLEDSDDRPGPTRVQAQVPKATSAQSQDQSQGPVEMCCGRQMMTSKYPNRDTGAFDWYCTTCRGSKAKGAA